jgi:hypothetical protein
MNTAAILITTALVIANSVGMHVMTGAVSSIDSENVWITLSDGTTLKLPKGMGIGMLRLGELVEVTYSRPGSGKTQVSRIRPASGAPHQ